MFNEDSPRTWVGLILYGFAAVVLFACGALTSQPLRTTSVLLANILVIAGIVFVLSANNANSSRHALSDIFRQYRSGNRKPFTTLQKVCAILGLFMVVVITMADTSL